MSKHVTILGGGVGGLSAAQELAERGFRVTVYDRQSVFGGKARSIPVPNSGVDGRKDLPGEHGFRFFPGFYRHVTDTMKRIPYGTNANGVFDNLVTATRTQIARVGKKPIVLPARLPETPDDWAAAFRALFLSQDLGVPKKEVLYFIDRILVLLTSCEERRLAEYERSTWWTFIGAAKRSVAYQRVLGQGQTRSLVAMRAEEASTRTVGFILLQLLFGALGGGGFDRLLNGPTNDVWIDPWLVHLRNLGVELNTGGTVDRFHVANGRISKVTVSGADVESDCYVAAMPVEIMASLLTDELKTAAPSLANLGSLKTEWMNGIQYYLDRDVPVTHGHSLHVDSPWALTSVSQKQFWTGIDLTQYGDGRVEGILSVDISNWDEPGVLYGKPAQECTADEIAKDTWEQLKQHLNSKRKVELSDENLLGWFLDPDIQFPNPSMATNAEPLLINTAGSLEFRPEAYTEIPNLFLASDYVRTHTDIACMEAANEAARRAVNALLDETGSAAQRCTIWPLEEPEIFKPLREFDRVRFKLGLPHA